MTEHMTPAELRKRAEVHDRQGKECWRAGLVRASGDHADQAKNLRQLAAEAESRA